MASSLTSLQQLADQLTARSKTLVNNDLKKICKEEGAIQSGNKIALQGRVQNSMFAPALSRSDAEALQRLRHRIYNHGEAPPPDSQPTTPGYPAYSSPTAPMNSYQANGYTNQNNYPPYAQQSVGPQVRLIFKDSPFFEVREHLLQNITLDVSPSHRQNVSRALQLTSDLCLRMKNDPTLRLFLFSSAEDGLGPYARHDISFPSQIEVKVNGDEVRANFKGLKNKPGSTRPADLTDLVRKTAQYRNTIQITYALTQKKFSLHLFLVKKLSVDELTRTITRRSVITKQTVVNEMLKKANDPDIVVDSINLSLKDPISTLRITVPCRSTICSHNQCFDAESFLQLQEQAPTWQCPICNKTVSFEGLAVDQYVQDILDSVPKSTDQVTIQPNGEWTTSQKSDNRTPQRNGYSQSRDEESDDDIVEIPDYRVSAIKSEAVHTPLSMTRTPPAPSASRDSSTAPRTGSKRASEVIDLTLSDEDEPPRPAKKVAYSTPSSLPDQSRRYPLPPAGNASVPMRPPSHPQSHSVVPPSIRLDFRPASQNQSSHSPYGVYRQPAPPSRPSYQNPGSQTNYGYGDSP
ncbi:E3 SUMO-protein ligase PIAS1 [Polyplosphaeria fusca]|uniref:E3 SUMO-protein ligase PIAS1 n=1 Tax=Polyplosphaeria fusca TaxID=682080 RepID=A0A9P4QYL8_9PLEO|nr:E3 SUMO-protein ligase PIAS1 [Polyplosphaeria fusca]